MKYFIVHLTQQDGEHEHTSKFIAKGNNEDDVKDRIIREQLYEYGEKEPEESMLAYFDGQTAVQRYWIQPITKNHFEILYKHNYMHEV